MVLVTVHRRENFGAPLRRIAAAVRRIVAGNPGVVAVLPTHPNPNVQETILRDLGSLERLPLVPPLPYGAFVATLARSYFVLADSGGVQASKRRRRQ